MILMLAEIILPHYLKLITQPELYITGLLQLHYWTVK